MKNYNVLSLFDGMGCGYIALKQKGIKFTYYRSEIDKHCNKLASVKMPDAINLGDVQKVSGYDLPKMDIILAGSPCQGFSFAGKQSAFDDPRSKLFFEFVRIWKECKEVNPNVKFLLENTRMRKESQVVINYYMNLWPIEINSALVTAQSRNRLYWTDIKTKSVGLFGDLFTDIPQPEDRGIMLSDVLDKKVKDSELKLFKTDKILPRCVKPNSFCQIDGKKSYILLAGYYSAQNAGQYIYYKGNFVRMLTLSEMCKLQGMPLAWFFDNEGNQIVSTSQAAHMLGNGWTIPVIEHILNFWV